VKRHKYVFYKFPKKLIKSPNLQLKYIATSYLLKNTPLLNLSTKFALNLFKKEFSMQPSKINTYCLITGRTRFTVKKTQTSRQIFFEHCSFGYNTGFFLS
jgi:ribosomal protein S14